MTINLTPEQRHKAMLANKSKDTKIEILLRKSLWHKGIRYRKNYKIFSCKPDIVITKYKLAIFCDGDFWHGKPSANHNFKTNKKLKKSGQNRLTDWLLSCIISIRQRERRSA